MIKKLYGPGAVIIMEGASRTANKHIGGVDIHPEFTWLEIVFLISIILLVILMFIIIKDPE